MSGAFFVVGRRFEYVAVIALLAAFVVQALDLIWTTSATVDEDGHFGAGVSYWVNGDFRIQTFNGFLTQKLMGWPASLAHRPFPSETAQAAAELSANRVGDLYLFTLGHDPVRLLAGARVVVMLIGTALGLGVWWWARKLFGVVGGLASLVFYVCSAGMVANSALASTDVLLAALFFGSAWCYWQMLHRPSWATAALVGLGAGGLLLTKYSALGFIPLALALLVWRCWRCAATRARWRRILWCNGAAMLVAIVTLWAFFGFRYRPGNFAPGWTEAREGTKLHGAITFLRHVRLLPEPYLYFLQGSRTLVAPRYSFFRGEHRNGGRLVYFPATLLLKTAPWLIGAATLAVALTWRRWPVNGTLSPATGANDKVFQESVALWAIAGTYLGCCLVMNLNIGHRHLLPVYPPLCVLAGGAIAWLWHHRAPSGAAVLLLGSLAETAILHGRQHTYFSPLGGGPAAAYQWFVDSSVDWGTDLPHVARWQEKIFRREPLTRFYLAHLGVDYPQAYGVRGTLLNLPFAPASLRAGLYVFSASVHQSGTIFHPGDYRGHEERYQALRARIGTNAVDEDFARLCVVRLAAWCRWQRPPDERIGDTYFVYRLSHEDVRAALDGPAPAPRP